MADKRCPEGHFYDPAKYTTCPHCTVTDVGDVGSVTQRQAEQGEERTEPATPRSESYRDPSDAGPTVGEFPPKLGINPVVAWLVSVGGPERGRDFRVFGENNSIGRSELMRICIAGDARISRETHSIISYDPRGNEFTLIPGGSSGLVYMDGAAVHMPTTLQPYARITMGDTTLLFVPLCGEHFRWDSPER